MCARSLESANLGQKKTGALIQSGGQSPRGVSTNETFVKGHHALAKSDRNRSAKVSAVDRVVNTPRGQPAPKALELGSQLAGWRQAVEVMPIGLAERELLIRCQFVPAPWFAIASQLPSPMPGTRRNKKAGCVATTGMEKMVARGGLEPPTPAL